MELLAGFIIGMLGVGIGLVLYGIVGIILLKRTIERLDQ